jgi:predicted metal-dependent HD superfamily phosphohydrolase
MSQNQPVRKGDPLNEKSVDADLSPIDEVGESVTESIGATVPESIGSTIWPMTTSGLLLERWERAWDALNGVPRTGFFETMISRYTEPKRHYHTLQHLAECFDAFDAIAHHCLRPFEVEMAIWFHDAIYDVTRQDNEERSADLAFQSLSKSGVEVLCASRVSKLVLGTDHRSAPTSQDARVLSDVDLWILGSPEERFRQYEDQIRWEYTAHNDGAYIEGRQKVVRHFLNLCGGGETSLFHAAEFKSGLQAQAKANLEGSLQRLQAGILPVRLPMMIQDGIRWLDGSND